MEILQAQSLDDIRGVNDVAEGLAHLPSVCITNHSMAVDLLEWHLASEVDTKEDHTRHPEEEDIPTGFEDGRGVEVSEISSLLGPSHDREGPQSGGEPGVEDIFILLESEGASVSDDLGTFEGFVICATDNPVLVFVALLNSGQYLVYRCDEDAHILVVAFNVDEVCRATMSPPELTRDTPILDTIEPPVPLVLGGFGLNEKFASAGSLWGG